MWVCGCVWVGEKDQERVTESEGRCRIQRETESPACLPTSKHAPEVGAGSS